VTRRGQRGQAAIELLAMVPTLIVVGLLAWQLMSVIGAGLRVQAEVRVMAIRAAAGAAGDVVVVSTHAPVPVVLPGSAGMEVPARVGVRVP